jgi:hypothetical protein
LALFYIVNCLLFAFFYRTQGTEPEPAAVAVADCVLVLRQVFRFLFFFVFFVSKPGRITREITLASTSTTRGHCGCIFTAIADCAT